jgi:hypothetical protein
MFSLSAQELMQWPIIHGVGISGKYIENIRVRGLLSPKSRKAQGKTSVSYDEILGRGHYIFLQVVHLDPDYTLGSGKFFLIDPTVLDSPTTVFKRYDDVQKIVKGRGGVKNRVENLTLGWAFDGYASHIRNSDCLEKIIRKRILQGDETNSMKKILRSQEFQKYLELYQLTKDDFFQSISHRSNELGLSFDDFLQRENWQWSFEFEILVRDKIPPEYILGVWDSYKKEWVSWSQAKCEETEVRLRFYLDLLQRR